MNFKDAMNEVTPVTKTEYVRLTRMGYKPSEIAAMVSKDYHRIMAECVAAAPPDLILKNGLLNVWKSPITPKQMAYLRSFGYEFSEDDAASLKDGKVREFIDIINFAIDNKAFISAYPEWQKSSTKPPHKSHFNLEDIAKVHEQIRTNLVKVASPLRTQVETVIEIPDDFDPVVENESAKVEFEELFRMMKTP